MMSNAKPTNSFLTSIKEALKTGHNGAVLALLEGRDVKLAIDSGKQTLLHFAAAHGNAFVTDYLVKRGCNVDASDEYEITPLMLAVLFRHAEVMRILIDAGADPCSVDSRGKGPIFYMKIVKDAAVTDVMRSAIRGNKAREKKAKKLCQVSNSAFYDFLSYICQMNNIFNDQCIIVFRQALQPEFFTEVTSTLQMFFYYGGADVNYDKVFGKTALHLAAEYMNILAIEWLLDRGADVNARDYKGCTPLHSAYSSIIRRNAMDQAVELLVRNGADLHASTPSGQTILELAKAAGNSTLIARELAFLEAQGKPLNARDWYFMKCDEHIGTYYQFCKMDFQWAKELKILNDTTLFDLLTKDTRTLTAYAKNKDFREKFTSSTVSVHFRMISVHFLSKFVRYVDLLNTKDQAAVALGEALPFLDELVIQRIIEYLSPDERRLLVGYS